MIWCELNVNWSRVIASLCNSLMQFYRRYLPSYLVEVWEMVFELLQSIIWTSYRSELDKCLDMYTIYTSACSDSTLFPPVCLSDP